MKAIVQHNLLNQVEANGLNMVTSDVKKYDHITDPRLIGIAIIRKGLEERELDSNVKILVKDGKATCEEGKRLLERKLNENLGSNTTGKTL